MAILVGVVGKVIMGQFYVIDSQSPPPPQQLEESYYFLMWVVTQSHSSEQLGVEDGICLPLYFNLGHPRLGTEGASLNGFNTSVGRLESIQSITAELGPAGGLTAAGFQLCTPLSLFRLGQQPQML